jgi:hypothetical protein
MLKIERLLIVVCAVFLLNADAAAQVGAPDSRLIGARLPEGAVRVADADVPAEIRETLAKLIALGGDKVRQGEFEVLLWTNANGYRKSNAPKIICRIVENLQSVGWNYAVGEQQKDFTIFSSMNMSVKRGVMGFFAVTDESLLLAWTEMLPANGAGAKQSPPVNYDSRPTNDNNAGKIVRVGADENYVNVMGDEMPPLPQFPALSPKPGKVRGYVKDWTGKPLAGAQIGIRSSYLAGYYSGGRGKTDANGYYEIAPPKGMAHFYNAGYQIQWGGGLAAVALHPADGKLDSFITTDGAVENFVLLPYGITSRENLQQNPHLPATFYGGAIFLNWYSVEANDNNAPPFAVKAGSTLEITLTPEEKLLDGAPLQTFVIRKTLGMSGSFRIHNIPLGRYRISLKANGRPLKIKDNKSYNAMFGMTPAEAVGTASILFVPASADASMVGPQNGAWQWISLNFQMP